MGSPISGYLAKLKLRPLETEIMENFEIKPSVRIRYVDNIFENWDHDLRPLNNFLLKLNELDPKTKFTSEIEKEGILPLLDIKLIKNGYGS